MRFLEDDKKPNAYLNLFWTLKMVHPHPSVCMATRVAAKPHSSQKCFILFSKNSLSSFQPLTSTAWACGLSTTFTLVCSTNFSVSNRNDHNALLTTCSSKVSSLLQGPNLFHRKKTYHKKFKKRRSLSWMKLITSSRIKPSSTIYSNGHILKTAK